MIGGCGLVQGPRPLVCCLAMPPVSACPPQQGDAMTLIASLQNTQVKQIRALGRRSEREHTGLFFVESPRAVIEAIQLRVPLDTLVVAPALLKNARLQTLVQAQQRAGGRCLAVTPEVFESLVLKE